jgi:hypothetical protein
LPQKHACGGILKEGFGIPEQEMRAPEPETEGIVVDSDVLFGGKRFWTDYLYSLLPTEDGQAGWMKEEPPSMYLSMAGSVRVPVFERSPITLWFNFFCGRFYIYLG